MDGSGVLTRQPGGRTGEAWFLGPWHVGRADDGGGEVLPSGGPQNAEPACGLGQFLTFQSLRRDPGMSKNRCRVEAGARPQRFPSPASGPACLRCTGSERQGRPRWAICLWQGLSVTLLFSIIVESYDLSGHAATW